MKKPTKTIFKQIVETKVMQVERYEIEKAIKVARKELKEWTKFLKDAEKKLKEKEEQEKIRLDEEQKNKQENKPDYVSKKNVFAKFKSYNREAGSGRVNTVAPPKNSIPNHSNTKDNNEKVLLKERANRYSHEGRFSNFNILKKTSRKVVDKKYAMSFADFKKIQASKLNKNNN